MARTNKHGYPGVTFYKPRGTWRAKCCGETIGYYKTIEEAAAAYAKDLAERRAAFVPLTIKGAVAVLPLTKGKFAVIDVKDWPLVAGRRWTTIESDSTCYAKTNVNGNMRLHHVLTGWAFVDHRDGNGLNNTRRNLREATSQKNQRNRRSTGVLGFKGIRRKRRRFTASIHIDRKEIRLGTFDTPEAAAMAYDTAARQHFQEFACVNFAAPGERSARLAVG